jgi:DNA polymerase I
MMVNGKRLVFLDIETNTKHDQIWCCVTKADGEVKVWTEARKLNEYLEPNDLIVGHNLISFDARILNQRWNTKIRLSQCKDTLIMSRLLNPNRENGHSLAAFGLKLGFQKIDFSDYDGGLSDEMVQYCIRDVELLEKVYHELENEKRILGFSEQSVELEHEVAAIITRQERRGFKLDVPKSMEFVASLRDKAGHLEQRLQEVFQPITHIRVSEKTGKPLKDRIEVFNPSSRQQISKRLQEKGWKPEKFTEKGQIIINEDVLLEIIKNAEE